VESIQKESTPERYEAVAAQIASDASPVGIDAKKTHVMILMALERIEQRLERLESRSNQGGTL